MTHSSLFSGIGGFDLAAQWMGWDNLFHCEIDPFCEQILKYYWPDATQYTDIRETDFTIWRGRVDVLTGGFPCQPFSLAGKRRGTEDERHLWPQMLRAIREVRPRWVVGENVLGIVSWDGGLVFEQVCADLEAAGYEVQPFVLPAAGVNAPHSRYRVWFIAHATLDRDCGTARELCEENGRPDGGMLSKPVHPSDLRGSISDTDQHRQRHGPGKQVAGGECPRASHDSPHGETRIASDTGGEQLQERTPHAFATDREETGSGLDDRIKRSGYAWPTAHAPQHALQDGVFDPADVGETDCGQAAGGLEYGDLSKDWDDFPTQSPVCGRDDGLSARLDGITFPKWRAESIKAYGNAIVPQVALQIFKTIEKYENLYL